MYWIDWLIGYWVCWIGYLMLIIPITNYWFVGIIIKFVRLVILVVIIIIPNIFQHILLIFGYQLTIKIRFSIRMKTYLNIQVIPIISLWTCIFHMRPHSIGDTLFYFSWKIIIFGKSWNRHLFYLFLIGKIK